MNAIAPRALAWDCPFHAGLPDNWAATLSSTVLWNAAADSPSSFHPTSPPTPQSSPLPDSSRSPLDVRSAPLAKGRVLLVEDDAVSANALRLFVTRFGGTVVVAANIAQALRELATAPDAVVLDLMLPDGDGVAVLQHIRKNGIKTRVAITTGVTDPGRLGDLGTLSPDRVLRKPIDLDALLRAIDPQATN